MRLLTFTFILFLGACANHRQPVEVTGHEVARDSLAKGNVKASAVKHLDNQDVCFDITLKLSGTTMQEALPRNWSLAWVDKKNQYHLISLNQRDPASIPRGGSTTRGEDRMEWSNTFRTCTARAELDDVKSIVLTPKQLPFADKRSLRLNWE